jgi:hypothetical protein
LKPLLKKRLFQNKLWEKKKIFLTLLCYVDCRMCFQLVSLLSMIIYTHVRQICSFESTETINQIKKKSWCYEWVHMIWYWGFF